MRTITDLSFFRFVTLTQEPSGSVRWAAVKSCISYGSPLAVFLCWNTFPYHEALPTWNFLVGTGLMVSWVCPGVPWFESGVLLLPGAAPSAVVKSRTTAAWFSTRSIKHLASKYGALPNRLLNFTDRAEDESIKIKISLILCLTYA